jgi:hypothetical protein
MMPVGLCAYVKRAIRRVQLYIPAQILLLIVRHDESVLELKP